MPKTAATISQVEAASHTLTPNASSRAKMTETTDKTKAVLEAALLFMGLLF